MAAEGRPILAAGHADESPVETMAGGTSVMRLWIAWTDGVAGGGMASRAIGVHADRGLMVHAGVIIDKGAVTG